MPIFATPPSPTIQGIYGLALKTRDDRDIPVGIAPRHHCPLDIPKIVCPYVAVHDRHLLLIMGKVEHGEHEAPDFSPLARAHGDDHGGAEGSRHKKDALHEKKALLHFLDMGRLTKVR